MPNPTKIRRIWLKLQPKELSKLPALTRKNSIILFLHINFGETKVDNNRIDILPTLAARAKQKLGIANPYTVAYDLLFGCPGWIQALIQADYYIRSGDAKKILVIGADILSRISDPHDRDSMIYADGAGAAIIEARESDEPIGIIGHNSRSDALEYANMLHMGYSYNPELAEKKELYLKMNGRRLYQYALENVPKTIKDGLDKLKLHISDVKKCLSIKPTERWTMPLSNVFSNFTI